MLVMIVKRGMYRSSEEVCIWGNIEVYMGV